MHEYEANIHVNILCVWALAASAFVAVAGAEINVILA